MSQSSDNLSCLGTPFHPLRDEERILKFLDHFFHRNDFQFSLIFPLLDQKILYLSKSHLVMSCIRLSELYGPVDRFVASMTSDGGTDDTMQLGFRHVGIGGHNQF
eukprot:GHVP01028078.1.p1 GENE.GHVP01028078.1~~GHVP01028078.1.p1  ORF type:complete len:105 (-),score=8.19 GHVP01028078.1:793-1107(-)